MNGFSGRFPTAPQPLPDDPRSATMELGTKIRAGGFAIVVLKIVIYGITFAVILAFAGAIVALSMAVAPEAAKSSGLSSLAVALSGLALAGGVVYLAEKLVNLGKGAGQMMFDLIVEKYKQHQLETGIKIGRERGREEGLAEGREEGLEQGRQEAREQARQEAREQARQEAREHGRASRAWYERQQAAFRAGLPFDEPPPFYDPEAHANGADAG